MAEITVVTALSAPSILDREKRKRDLTDWKRNNPDRVREHKRRDYERHKDGYLRRAKESVQRRREAVRVYLRNYNRKNRPKLREQSRIKRLHRWKTDANYRMRRLLTHRIKEALKSQSARRSHGTMRLLGCSIADFRMYLESRFQSGMTWQNYGKVWHVDHIMPCAIFDLTKDEHQKRCFHFSNMQPLFAGDNIRKGASVLTNQFQLL